MSSETKEKKDEEVIVKLDKVADSLEVTSNQLSGVVTQQQLDLIRERIVATENDISILKSGFELLAERTAVHATDADAGLHALADENSALERDFAGLRALVVASFVLATICLVGLIVVSV